MIVIGCYWMFSPQGNKVLTHSYSNFGSNAGHFDALEF